MTKDVVVVMEAEPNADISQSEKPHKLLEGAGHRQVVKAAVVACAVCYDAAGFSTVT